jgi:hypothetical protein
MVFEMMPSPGDGPIDRIDITLESSSLVGTAAHLYVVIVVIAPRSIDSTISTQRGTRHVARSLSADDDGDRRPTQAACA